MSVEEERSEMREGGEDSIGGERLGLAVGFNVCGGWVSMQL